MTVEDLTKLHPYMEYLCGRSGSGAEISYIDIIDIVEIPEGSVWTSAGDFIITTGYFLQTAGIPRQASRLVLCAAYRHSRFALELGRTIQPKKTIYRYLDYIEYDFIRENLSISTLERLAAEYLAPLLDYDSQKSASLVKTLSVLDDCAYNIQQTSAALGIHRNTLYDRTRKSGELLGHSLGAKLTRDAIHLALVFFTLKQLP